MELTRQTIHDRPGNVFDCSCVIGVECDGETLALRFPQIERPDDNLSPMVYVCMNGTKLTVRLCDRDDVEWGFEWAEDGDRWIQRDAPNAGGQIPPASGGNLDRFVGGSV